MDSRGKTGRRNKTIKQYRSRIMRLLHECGWEYLKDVTPDSFMKWRSAFNGAAKTKNHYLADCCTFLNWMVQYQRAPRNPLCSVRKVEVAGKLQRVRRAFTNEELERLFAVAPAYRKMCTLLPLGPGCDTGSHRNYVGAMFINGKVTFLQGQVRPRKKKRAHPNEC